ncbi:hypothetical protein F5X96DRAFT_406279 [Biscogniauxia mediterranea]|nr:hypothetical protein F5X96DRAFT_406279 [Biscogniauxia mediterranea]
MAFLQAFCGILSNILYLAISSPSIYPLIGASLFSKPTTSLHGRNFYFRKGWPYFIITKLQYIIISSRDRHWMPIRHLDTGLRFVLILYLSRE